jgi:hypothetical protein
MARGDFSPIPEPMLSLPSHQETLTAIKDAVEVLTRQRKVEQVRSSAVTWNDLLALGLVQEDQVPKR